LIPRYTRPEMGRIWSDENRFRTWLAVEVAASETLAEAGMVPKEAAQAIRERADFRVERIHEIEAEVRHDVIAFTTAWRRLSARMPADSTTASPRTTWSTPPRRC